MKKIYKQSYFNRKNWILENFDKLSLTTDETMLVLLIELARDNNKTVTYDYFKKKLNYDAKTIDRIVASLVAKGYLAITPRANGVSFDTDNLFEFDPQKYEAADAKDVYSVAEGLLKRPLSSNEVQKLSDLLNEYTQNQVIDAIRVAEAYRKSSLAYVETTLKNEKR